MFAVFAMALGACAPAGHEAATDSPKPSPHGLRVESPGNASDRLVIRLCKPLGGPALGAFLYAHQLHLVKQSSPVLLTVKAHFPDEVPTALQSLRRDRRVCAAEPDAVFHAMPGAKPQNIR